MRDTLAILRKECLELAGERDTRRGGGIQLLVIPWGPVVPLTAACIWLTVCSSFAFETIAIGMSLQTTSARASQQISSVVILVVFAAGLHLWQELSLALTLSAFCVGGAVALVGGGLGLFVLSRRFRRERLFARS